ncbi:hypothetical protein K474DRAFT_1712565 [Panus rudis PR-1116 ss-1]|nr:hypothetical protein K474DRAFT_1712565 [Panus rudis PR-1116 ss-1]
MSSCRVNAAHIADFIGMPVILTCCIKEIKENVAIVTTTDLEIIYIIPGQDISGLIPGQTGELRGTVQDRNTVIFDKFLERPGLNFSFVNRVIEMTFDPRFANMF